jgi:hypothetical protein
MRTDLVLDALKMAKVTIGFGPLDSLNQFETVDECRFVRPTFRGLALNTTAAHRPPSTTILVCEDDEQLRVFVEMMLASPRLGIPTPRGTSIAGSLVCNRPTSSGPDVCGSRTSVTND